MEEPIDPNSNQRGWFDYKPPEKGYVETDSEEDEVNKIIILLTIYIIIYSKIHLIYLINFNITINI